MAEASGLGGEPSGVDGALDRAREALERLPDREPFSPQGFDMLERSVAEYIRSLVLESTRTARRQGADLVSGSDVQQAARYLFRSPERSLIRHVGTGGGVLLGAALSNGLALISAERRTTTAILVTLAMAIVGTFMVAFYAARDIR